MSAPEDHGQRTKNRDTLDTVVKGVGALLVSAAITFYGVHSDAKQVEIAERNRKAQVLVQTLSSRETATSDMRAKMFTTLVEHYFENTADDSTRVVILEMIGHNFGDHLYLRPLFQRLDARLRAKGSDQRPALRAAARNIAQSQLRQIVGSGGEVCSLELAVGETRTSPCIQPVKLTLRAVTDDRALVTAEPGDPEDFEVSWFEMPLSNHGMLGELEYTLLLSETAREAGRASFQVVRLPLNQYSPDNRLRMDQLIADLTVEDF
jgi:hypothetical protein